MWRPCVEAEVTWAVVVCGACLYRSSKFLSSIGNNGTGNIRRTISNRIMAQVSRSSKQAVVSVERMTAGTDGRSTWRRLRLMRCTRWGSSRSSAMAWPSR